MPIKYKKRLKAAMMKAEKAETPQVEASESPSYQAKEARLGVEQHKPVFSKKGARP